MEKRMLPHAFFVITTLLCVGTKSFSEPTNIGTLKAEIKQYYDTGAYNKEVAAVATNAEAYIKARAKTNAKRPNPAKLAIVLDIDDTSLSNYPDLASRDFCVNKNLFDKNISRGNSPAIAPILALYQQAVGEKVAVFFVTGRPSRLQKPTENNLKTAGYKTWNGIFFRPKEDTNQSVVPYKTQARSTITKEGYTIIASIGDQDSDMAGGYVEKTFKLPNPFYYLK